MTARIYITKSRAGHYTATLREPGTGYGEYIFRSAKKSTAQAARYEVEQFLANRLSQEN